MLPVAISQLPELLRETERGEELVEEQGEERAEERGGYIFYQLYSKLQ